MLSSSIIHFRPAGVALLAFGLLAFATPAFSETGDVHERAALEFRAYCAQCHGLKGEGDGPVAGTLKVAPPDLTGMAQRNGGTFPGRSSLQDDLRARYASIARHNGNAGVGAVVQFARRSPRACIRVTKHHRWNARTIASKR